MHRCAGSSETPLCVECACHFLGFAVSFVCLICFSFLVLRPVKIISIILIQVNRKVGQKKGDPREKTPDHHKQNLACLTCSNSQWWDDKWLTALKIRILNHSATGPAYLICGFSSQSWFYSSHGFTLWLVLRTSQHPFSSNWQLPYLN